MDSTQRKIRQDIFRMVWPATMESVLQFTVGIVATAMVGRLGAVSIGAVGLSQRLLQTVWALSQAVTVGATVLVAQAYGAGRRDAAGRSARQSLLVALFGSAAFTLAVLAGPNRLLGLFHPTADVLGVAVGYLRIVAWGVPFTMLMLVIGSIMRGAGDTRTPLSIAILVNVVNVAGNYLLIFGHLGFPALGVRGSAVATLVAQATGVLVAGYLLFTPGPRFGLRFCASWRPDVAEFRRLLGIGVPAAAESLAWQFAAVLLTILIVSFGTVALAAHTLGIQAEGLSYMPAAGFAVASTTLVGQNLGARDPGLARRYTAETARWAGYMTLMTTAALVFFPATVMGLLTNDRAVVGLGAKYLRLMGLAQLPQQLGGVLNGALRGSGDTRSPMLIAFAGLWLIRLPLAFLLGRHFGLGIIGVWVAMTLDLFVRYGLIHLTYVRRQRGFASRAADLGQ
ncbi:MAG: MATE family efflux transporter [Bacillota bacterium]